ncbi:hypothetical protein ASG89_23470 [Paenibacillus sp. Soil766]|uniref:hypothetical protein n=1 Tax=Paenibacillus sp. Soil766 TaxID=1736404 RepID=UPI0007093099|nr:hypothetical protein [Paenibacillus sp. Soil766]KRF03400.1 hypothetical protein ASG89_23470 [Paenibacillus sp. Soil766]
MKKRASWRKLIVVGTLSFNLLIGWNSGHAAAIGLAPETLWAKNYDTGFVLSEVQEMSGDGYTVMGTSEEGKIFLANIDEQGNQQWSKVFQLQALNSSGIEKQVTVSSIRHLDNGGYIVGGTVPGFYFRYNEYVIVKTDENGVMQWTQVFDSGAYGHFNMIRQAKDGGYINAIFTESLNVGSFHTSVQKRNRSGMNEWTTVLGTGGPNSPHVEARTIEETADGGYIVSGTKGTNVSIWKLNSSGKIEWEKTYSCNGGYVIQTTEGGYLIVGSRSEDETVLIKTDAIGEESWTKTLDGGQTVSLTNTSDGGYLVGQSHLVIKTDAAGTIQWSKPVSGLTKAISVKSGGAMILSSPETLMKLAVYSSPPQTGLKLDSEDYSLSVGQTLDTVLTSVYGDRKVNVSQYGSYSTADPSILTVDRLGNITGLKYGQTVLTATYNGLQTTANVYVYP